MVNGAGQDVFVASLANDMRVQGKPAKAPLATHPAFPFIVAVWFAALLGLGSLVVPVPLIEQISVATGIASIVPAAAPPLGFTARALIALAFTVGGAFAGLLIARQVAKAHRAEHGTRIRTVATNSARQPILAHAELGDEGFDGRAVVPRGRRSLAIDIEERPSDFLELAPMPGTAHAIAHDSGLSSLANAPAPVAPLSAASDALELTEFAVTEVSPSDFDAPDFDTPNFDTPEPAPTELALTELERARRNAEAAPGFTAFEPDTGNNTMHDRQIFQRPGDDSEHTARQEFRYAIEPVSQIAPSAAPAVALTLTNAWTTDADEADEAEDVEVAPPQPVDALHFSPPSLARQVFASEVAAKNEAAEYQREFNADDAAATTDTSEHDMDDIGLVQLAQRLGASIEKRRELLAARAELLAAAAAVPTVTAAPAIAEDFDVAAPDEAAEAMAAYFSQPQAVAGEENEAEADAAEPDLAAGPHPVAPSASRARTRTGTRQIFEPVEDADPAKLNPLAGLARIDIDDDDEDDDDIENLAASFSLPIGRLTSASVRPVAAEPAHFAPPVPAPQAVFQAERQEFVRIEDEPELAEDEVQPAVVFPAEAATPAPSPFAVPAEPVFESEAYQAQARIHTEEHERALRDALLNLQRMSGTA